MSKSNPAAVGNGRVPPAVVRSAAHAAGPVWIGATPDAQATAPMRLLRAWLESGPVGGGVCTAAELEARLATDRGASALILVEAPTAWLERVLRESPDRDTEAALTAWCAAARTLLRTKATHPTRCLCADLVEVASAPASWSTIVERWIGDPGPAAATPPSGSGAEADSASMLESLVLRSLVAADPDAGRLFEELQACCVVLDPAAPPTRVPQHAPAPLAELRLLRAQAAAREEVERHARQQAEDLHRQLQAARADADAARLGLASARAELAALTPRADTATKLQSDLDEARDRLGRCVQEWRALRAVPAILAHGDGPFLCATGVRIAAEQAAGTHRHVDLQLRDVSLNGRRWPDCDVRLVEHLGRPGLLLFDAPPAGPMVAAWRATGVDSGREFMLIVPEDDAGRAMLQQMGRSDWRVIVGLAGRVLAGLADAKAERWAGVAWRLCRQLAALPPRLRYDRLGLHGGSDAQPLRATFGGVMYGALDFETIVLGWDGAGAASAPELVATEGCDRLVLAHWPVGDEGIPAERWRVPVGAAGTSSEKRRAWARLAAADRELLLALLDALPAIDSLAPSTASARLAAAARAWHREARRHNLASAWLQRLRRLI